MLFLLSSITLFLSTSASVADNFMTNRANYTMTWATSRTASTSFLYWGVGNGGLICWGNCWRTDPPVSCQHHQQKRGSMLSSHNICLGWNRLIENTATKSRSLTLTWNRTFAIFFMPCDLWLMSTLMRITTDCYLSENHFNNEQIIPLSYNQAVIAEWLKKMLPFVFIKLLFWLQQKCGLISNWCQKGGKRGLVWMEPLFCSALLGP